MLTSAFVFALALSACAAQSYDNEVTYQVVATPPRRNLLAEAAEARSRIYNLGASDVMINNRLDNLMAKIDAVTAFRNEFESTIEINIESGMNQQDARIRYFREQLREQAGLIQDVEALQTRVDNILEELQQLRAARNQVLFDIQALEDADIVQNQQISDIQAQVNEQGDRIEEVESNIESNEQTAYEVYSNLITVVNIVNEEAAVTFDVVLTPENPVVNFTYDTPFTVAPGVHWGIVGYNIEDVPVENTYYARPPGYGAPPPPTPEEVIYTQVNVVADENGGTATLVDGSQGWDVLYVKARVTVFTANNDVIEYVGTQPYTP